MKEVETISSVRAGLKEEKSLNDEGSLQWDICIGPQAWDEIGELSQHHLKNQTKIESVMPSVNAAIVIVDLKTDPKTKIKKMNTCGEPYGSNDYLRNS